MITAKRITVLLVAIVIVSAVIACNAHQQSLKLTCGTVKGFSLGSTKAPVFKVRPSAKELYATLVKFYGSFESYAASGTLRLRLPDLSQMDDDSKAFEYGFMAPDKDISIDYSVQIHNGKDGIFYDGKSNTYTKTNQYDPNRSPQSWLGLVCNKDERIVGIRLLNDTKGNKVYVLEIRMTNPEIDRKKWPPDNHIFYVGKTDLLPRRTVLTYRDRVNGNRFVYYRDFARFIVNVKLDEQLFSTVPRKGSTPMGL